MREPTSKYELPKTVHTLPALQDGGFKLSLKYFKQGRLHLQIAFEGRILFSYIKPDTQSLFNFVGQESFMSFFAFALELDQHHNLHQISQNSSLSTASTKHINHILLCKTCC